jgi:uncharacterized membrane protein YphA (DoxX/SURF4 family)
MLNDPNLRNTFVPLVLRLTLAAIFIYHGVTKIADPRNDWGAMWATNLWQKQGAVPKGPMEELNKGLARLANEKVALSKQGDELKLQGEKLPAGPEKEDIARQQAENASLLERNSKQQEDFVVAQERVRLAFAASTEVPDALSYQWVQLLVAWGELLCGLAMLFGLFTRVAALALIVIMVGAIYTVTGPKGFSDLAGAGYEYNLAIVAMCVVLIIKGSGPVSIDNWFRSRAKAAEARPQHPVGV